MSRFRHYRNLHKTEGRLRALLRDFHFGTVRDLLASCAGTVEHDPAPHEATRETSGHRHERRGQQGA